MKQNDIRVVLLSEDAVVPSRKTKEAAGYDLSSTEEVTIPARGKASISTGIGFRFPTGCYGRISPRSGLARDHSVAAFDGVIDADYTGNVVVLLFNHGDKDYTVKKGDRIAQMVISSCVMLPVVVVESLEKTERGDKGFGSTGTGEIVK